MRGNEPFTGVGVALVTLFDEGGKIDVEATVAHAERVVADGVRAVLIAGSTGEAPALSGDERALLVAACRERLDADVTVIAGTGAAHAGEAVDLTRSAVEHGADAVLVLSPLRADDPRRYYDTVVASCDVPVLAYHVPGISDPGVPVELLPELGVAGIKDSSGDPTRLLREVTSFSGAVYTGSAALVVQAGAVGCAGAILALANVEPGLCVKAFAGDGEAQREMTAAHVAASTDFPHELKRQMAERFGTSTTSRMG